MMHSLAFRWPRNTGRALALALLLLPQISFAQSVDAAARILGGFDPRYPASGSLAERWNSEVLVGRYGTHPNIFSPSHRGQVSRFFAQSLGTVSTQTRGVIYFFGGADAIVPSFAFPNVERILMVGLEPVGRFPNPASMNAGQIAGQARAIGASFEYLLSRSYFVTSHMSNDLAQVGTSTAIAVGLVATGAQILALDYVSLNSNGDLVPAGQGRMSGMRITYAKANGQRAEVVYFSQDLGNEHIANRPEFEAYINKNNYDTAFYKAASFVPHWTAMNRINGIVYTKVRNIVQNDDGLPFHYFSSNPQLWSLKFFGMYTTPHSQFGASTQQDLRAAFSAVICDSGDRSAQELWARAWGNCQGGASRYGFASFTWNGYVPFRYGYSATTGPSNLLSWAEMTRLGNLMVATKVGR